MFLLVSIEIQLFSAIHFIYHGLGQKVVSLLNFFIFILACNHMRQTSTSSVMPVRPHPTRFTMYSRASANIIPRYFRGTANLDKPFCISYHMGILFALHDIQYEFECAIQQYKLSRR